MVTVWFSSVYQTSNLKYKNVKIFLMSKGLIDMLTRVFSILIVLVSQVLLAIGMNASKIGELRIKLSNCKQDEPIHLERMKRIENIIAPKQITCIRRPYIRIRSN